LSATPRGGSEEPLNPWLEDRLWKLGADGPVLDLGCGRGYWLERIGGAGLAVVGVEPDVERARLGAVHAPVAAGDGTRLPIASASLGLVWCIHVLHHLPDPVAALAEIRRVLRPDGHLILAETVDDNPIVRLGRRIHPEWDGVHIHSRFTAATLFDLVGRAGLDVVDRRQHSLVSFAAWGLPFGSRQVWDAVSRVESLLPASTRRWGAHVECVARAR
jgi:SAM-dependent methyltransferase